MRLEKDYSRTVVEQYRAIISCVKHTVRLEKDYSRTVVEVTVELYSAMQKIYVSMATLATIGHYGIYVALPQGPVVGPGIADVVGRSRVDMSPLWGTM
jgi:hypothetical protein